MLSVYEYALVLLRRNVNPDLIAAYLEHEVAAA